MKYYSLSTTATEGTVDRSKVIDKTSGVSTERLLFTLKETAAVANISLGKTIKMARNKELEVVRIGRAVRVPKRALLKLCAMEEL